MWAEVRRGGRTGAVLESGRIRRTVQTQGKVYQPGRLMFHKQLLLERATVPLATTEMSRLPGPGLPRFWNRSAGLHFRRWRRIADDHRVRIAMRGLGRKSCAPFHQVLGLRMKPPEPSGIEAGNWACFRRINGRSLSRSAEARNSTAAPRTGFREGTYTVTFF